MSLLSTHHPILPPYLHHPFIYQAIHPSGRPSPLTSCERLSPVCRLCLFFVVGMTCQWLLSLFAGMVTFSVYSDCDPLASGKIDKPDQIFTFLVLDKMGHLIGINGLFMSALYGAVLR